MAGFVNAMQSLTGGRFTLGLGRGIAPMQDALGISRITTAQMEDFRRPHAPTVSRRGHHGS